MSYCKFVIEISLSSEFFNINDIILTLNQSHHTMLAIVKNNVKKKKKINKKLVFCILFYYFFIGKLTEFLL